MALAQGGKLFHCTGVFCLGGTLHLHVLRGDLPDVQYPGGAGSGAVCARGERLSACWMVGNKGIFPKPVIIMAKWSLISVSSGTKMAPLI